MRLFDAPDLRAIQRNWPRISLRASVLLVVPVLVVWLAKLIGLYPTISMLPLPLSSLRAGPFAYEAKVIFAVVAILLGLAFLVPRRTPQLVTAVCVGAILWTGHIFIQLQWARLFGSQFNFRRDAAPPAAAWVLATVLLLVAIVYLLLENLIDTREQQRGRKLGAGETDEILRVGTRALGLMLAVGLGLSVALALAYAGLRALLVSAPLPFRLDPVFVLFAMGVGLAILVALAARKRSPVEGAALVPTAAAARAGPSAPAAAPAPGTYDDELRRRGV